MRDDVERFIREGQQDIEIETFCSATGRQANLILRCDSKDCKGETVKGKPIVCRDQELCPRLHAAKCFLSSIQMETKRRH